MEQHRGVPVSELSDAELERQGTRAHASRNWVFLHGTADQFGRHTERMLELEQEYLRRHPKRTWQGTGASAATAVSRVEQIRQVLRVFESQVDALLSELAEEQAPGAGGQRPTEAAKALLLARFAEAPGARMHKLEAHQAARELGLSAPDVAGLYKQDPPLLAAAGAYRLLTESGRDWLATHPGQA
ncbi:MAG: hypothetical protein ABS81_00965 [Pseudonocardia sp. SCN 72-86]|nr:MAG: hypothetical protein ABS81_00965 [Pseudonocardia sp. SCN 72-86]